MARISILFDKAKMKHQRANKGKLILQPMGGLANRMRIISVLFSLCKEVDAEFEVWWASNNDLGAEWGDLFDVTSFQVKNIKGNYVHAHRSRKWYKSLPHQIWAKLHRYSWLPYEDVFKMTVADTEDNSAKIREEWKRRLQEGDTLFISSGDNLGAVNKFSMFQPLSSISNQVETLISSITHQGCSLYGLHIRRTDNVLSIERSPLCSFEKIITNILNNERESKFYLASDDQATIDYLIDKFGDKIIVREKDFSRGTVSGIQDALIDMYLLSRTKKIYGSYFSSFSEMAGYIGSTKLEIVMGDGAKYLSNA